MLLRCIEREIANDLAAARKDGAPGLQKFAMTLESGFRQGYLTSRQFSVRRMFEYLVPNGRELMESWVGGVNGGYALQVLESARAVDTSAFSAISGQLYVTEVMKEWNNPELMWRDLVTIRPTKFNGEKIVGIASAADEIETVPEQGLYGATSLQEKWVMTPQLVKKGTTIALTREAVLQDNTGVLIDRAQSIAQAMAWHLEKRVLDMVFGITNTYNRMGSTNNTYLSSGAYINIASSNALTDYASIDTSLQLFEDMTDPDTGEPIMVSANTMIVPTALQTRADVIATATSVQVASGAGFISSSANNPGLYTYAPSPLRRQLRVMSSAYVKSRSGSASTWFIGNPKEAFRLMEGWPIEVIPAPPGGLLEFERDIVAAWKVSHLAVPAVLEPRHMVKCTA